VQVAYERDLVTARYSLIMSSIIGSISAKQSLIWLRLHRSCSRAQSVLRSCAQCDTDDVANRVRQHVGTRRLLRLLAPQTFHSRDLISLPTTGCVREVK